MSSKRIIVTMSTGNQGSAVVQALAKRNEQNAGTYEILAVSRDANSSKAKKLASLPGVKILESDYHPETIFKKATEDGKPIYGVYSVQSWTALPSHVGKGVEGEAKLGKEMADYAVQYKVQHFIYASLDFGNLDKTGVPHFESKRKVEEYIRSKTDLTYTFLRPVAFMNNFSMRTDLESKIYNTYLSQLIKGPIQIIAASDIGEFAAIAWDDQVKYKNQAISLAGDYLTKEQILQTVQQTKGKPLPLTFTLVPKMLCFLNEEMRTMMKFFNTTGFDAKIDELRQINPNLKNFKDFIETEM